MPIVPDRSLSEGHTGVIIFCVEISPMNLVEAFRLWFQQECHASRLTLEMLQSVPDSRKQDPAFARAVNLFGHQLACRTNWLIRMTGSKKVLEPWWPDCEFTNLSSKMAMVEAEWQTFIGGLSEDEIDRDFDFSTTSGTYRWNVAGQLMQLVGHGFYHRGQIALLVHELGGETVDTDYLYWAYEENPHRWGLLPLPTQ